MPDRYLIRSSDADFAIQTQITEDLVNARQLWQLKKQPSCAELYPRNAKAPFEDWLRPLLRRMRWQNSHPHAKSFLVDVSYMVTEHIRERPSLTIEQYTALAEHADCFKGVATPHYLTSMLRFTGQLEKDQPLEGRAAEALGVTLDVARRIYKSAPFWEQFVWPFFRSTALLDSGETQWEVAVRRDIESMTPKRRALWLRAFDGKYEQVFGVGEPTDSANAALKEIGKEALEADVHRWIELLKSEPATTMSHGGIVVFRYVLVLAKRTSSDVLDEILFAVATAPWRRPQDAGWLETCLGLLAGRSPDRAFTCLEALAMNPATATEDVKKEYDAALKAFVNEARGVGLDGYPWDAEPALEAHQRRIEELLQITAAAVTRESFLHPIVRECLGALPIPEAERMAMMKKAMAELGDGYAFHDVGPDVRASLDSQRILKDFEDDAENLHQAAANRLAWIRGLGEEYPRQLRLAWEQCFTGFCELGLEGKALRMVKLANPSQIVRTIQSSPGAWKVFELCQKHVEQHGWSADVVGAIREWMHTLETCHTENLYRAKAEWWLWFEDVTPINLEKCWGERVRRDLRAMKKEERQAWIALCVFSITAAPTKKWLKPAAAAFPKIGAAVFRKRFQEWFAPFATGDVLRLTVIGRNVLRMLIWSALIAEDPAVDEALAGFVNAQWKTRENDRCASQAEMAFAHVLAHRSPGKALPILEEMVRSGQAGQGSATHKIYMDLCEKAGRQPARPDFR